MKKWLLTLLLPIILAAGCAFAVGFFVGRSTVPYAVTVDKNVQSEEPAAAFEQPEADASEVAEESVGQINVNTASADELTELPGIGAKIAQRIVEYREKNGAFSTVEDIMNVSGIGEKKFLAIKDQITV